MLTQDAIEYVPTYSISWKVRNRQVWLSCLTISIYAYRTRPSIVCLKIGVESPNLTSYGTGKKDERKVASQIAEKLRGYQTNNKVS